jgi:hypothetical protein
MHVYRTLVSVFVMVDRNEGWPLPNNVGDDRGRVVDLTQVKNGRPSPSRPSLGYRPFYWVSVLDQSSEIPVNRFRSLGFPFLDQPNLCNRKRTTHAVRSMYNE